MFKNYIRCQHLKASEVTKKKPIGLSTEMKDSLEMTKYVSTSGLFNYFSFNFLLMFKTEKLCSQYKK